MSLLSFPPPSETTSPDYYTCLFGLVHVHEFVLYVSIVQIIIGIVSICSFCRTCKIDFLLHGVGILCLAPIVLIGNRTMTSWLYFPEMICSGLYIILCILIVVLFFWLSVGTCCCSVTMDCIHEYDTSDRCALFSKFSLNTVLVYLISGLISTYLLFVLIRDYQYIYNSHKYGVLA